jgi:hypothetical protein
MSKAKALGTTAPAPGTTANAPDDTITCIKYEAAVSEGKEILARSKRDQLRLGELAANVETKYGDRTLANFAKELGISPCTLERNRSVYLAWQKPAARPVSYADTRALQNHPNPYDIAAENPKLTEAEARKLMRPYKDAKDAAKCGTKRKAGKTPVQETEWDKHNRRSFKNLVTHGHEIYGLANSVLDSPPEKQREFFKVVEPKLMMDLRLTGSVLIELVKRYTLFEEAEAAKAEAQPKPERRERSGDASALQMVA